MPAAANSFWDLQIEKWDRNQMFAGAPLLPKFVSQGAAMYHELLKRGTSAADLKFLRRLRQTHFRNFKSKSGTRIICLLAPLLLPKFVREGAAMYHELRKRSTSAADLKFLRRLRQTHFRNFKSK